MKNTFITYVPGELELKKEDFVMNMKQFNENSTGFVYPDYEITIECEENVGKFKLLSNTTEKDEDREVRKKIIVLVNHNSSFLKLMEDDIFLNELYMALQSPEFYELFNKHQFNITIMKSANI